MPFELILLIALKTLLFPENNHISFSSYATSGGVLLGNLHWKLERV
jgi:hypothetical protein